MRTRFLAILTCAIEVSTSCLLAEPPRIGYRPPDIFLVDGDNGWSLKEFDNRKLFFCLLRPRKPRKDDKVFAPGSQGSRLYYDIVSGPNKKTLIPVDDSVVYDRLVYLNGDTSTDPPTATLVTMTSKTTYWRIVPADKEQHYYIEWLGEPGKTLWLGLDDQAFVEYETKEILKGYVWERRRAVLSKDKKYTFEITEPVRSK